MRKPTTLVTLVVAALVATLAATIPGALANSGRVPEAARSTDWAPVIPSKKAVSGVWGGGCVAVAANDPCSASVTIFPNAPVDLEGQDMGVLAGVAAGTFDVGHSSRDQRASDPASRLSPSSTRPTRSSR